MSVSGLSHFYVEALATIGRSHSTFGIQIAKHRMRCPSKIWDDPMKTPTLVVRPSACLSVTFTNTTSLMLSLSLGSTSVVPAAKANTRERISHRTDTYFYGMR